MKEYQIAMKMLSRLFDIREITYNAVAKGMLFVGLMTGIMIGAKLSDNDINFIIGILIILVGGYIMQIALCVTKLKNINSKLRRYHAKFKP